jgi:hypothetical protein
MTAALQPVQQGSPEQDRLIFGHLGAMLTDPAVHAALGGPVTSAPGDWWVLGVGPDGLSTGFAQLRIQRGAKAVRVRYLFDANNRKPALRALIRQCIQLATGCGAKTIHAYDRHTVDAWAAEAFKAGGPARGAFVRWERILIKDPK